MIEIAGKTAQGRLVAKGVYKFYETHGMPLDALFEALLDQNMIPDWLGFMLEAVEAGVKPERVIAMLDPPIADTYGIGVRNVVVVALRMMTAENREELPEPTVVLRLLPHEYEAIYGRLAKIGEPTFQQMMVIVGEVLGAYVVERMQGEVVGFQVVDVLPLDRFEKL